jgi:hypothetical protein
LALPHLYFGTSDVQIIKKGINKRFVCQEGLQDKDIGSSSCWSKDTDMDLVLINMYEKKL